ncbi:hypothetical protein FIU89_11135 [Roseovarius sp. THAF27]|uniref:hypothetical protein n=1 Tax=Roseovarius sp. THAF27 TaxID=2587850 RepID=UPI0012687081|nr:hypothetical protein [Roseovarius sp. THAF27]QFT81163.1 hypothetical protein FIU89_11135 [Roseovarius sp. THAF27]
MRGFEDISVCWMGVDYTLKARGIMPLVASIEDIISGTSGVAAVAILMGQNGGPTVSRVSMAFAAMLRHAGADVSDDEVYLSVQGELLEGSGDALSAMSEACNLLLAIVSPPLAEKMAAAMEVVEDFDAAEEAEKKA